MIGDEYDHDRRSLIIDRGGDNNQFGENDDDGTFFSSFCKAPICISVSNSVMDPKNQRHCVLCHLMMNIKKTLTIKKD